MQPKFYLGFIFISVDYFHFKDVKHREKTQVKMLRSTWHIIKMAFIKEESEEMKIEDTFRVKKEDTEEQTGWFHSQSW